MKRTELSRGQTHDAEGKRRFSTFKAPRKLMARSRMKRKSPRRLTRRAADAPFVKFVRSLACMWCQRPGPSDAAHMTLGPNEKGTSLKVDDRQVVPLCRRDHHNFDGITDGPRNPFRGWTKDERYAMAALWVRSVQLAVIPEDRAQADELGAGSALGAWLATGGTVGVGCPGASPRSTLLRLEGWRTSLHHTRVHGSVRHEPHRRNHRPSRPACRGE